MNFWGIFAFIFIFQCLIAWIAYRRGRMSMLLELTTELTNLNEIFDDLKKALTTIQKND